MQDVLQTATPLYIQITQLLQARIDKGDLAAGSKLPSESQLVESLGVSRVTVRKALAQLAEMGYTVSEKGRGTFVAYRKLKHNFAQLSGLTEATQGSGAKASSQLLEFDVQPANPEIADKLSIAEGDAVIYCARCRLLDEQVVSYEEFYIAQHSLPHMTEKDMLGSKFEYFRNHQVELTRTKQNLKPILPNRKISQILGVNEQQPILVNHSLNYVNDNQVFEFSTVYYNPDLYEFEIDAQSD
ncbi:transcriptional regulator [Vibrio ishigakensis]|uniref:Transcriptional regulator n=1 Tax=Vibrio ishigakensis TaxID=1481914 RepID=A0A0B8Q6C9_9VIBR|nr:transcriptional regulator [Vibrio ishigakensis]